LLFINFQIYQYISPDQVPSSRFISYVEIYGYVPDSAFSLPDVPITYLLAEAQNLEALEVGEVLAALSTVGALSERALGPLAVNLVLSPELLNGTGTGSTGKLGDGEVGKGGVREGENVTGHDLVLLGGGTVNEDL
jgi:hypothetical protein